VSTCQTVEAIDVQTACAQQTQRLGALLAPLLRSGDVVCLQGALGAGKTCLAQGIGRALGVSSPMTSPTFIIVHEYALPERPYRLYHIDLYRIEGAAEACATGLEDLLFGDGVCVIEWAERIVGILPKDRLWITLQQVGDSQRELSLQAHGQRSAELLKRLSDALRTGPPQG
jgi:tRNA threonylcarbamoyladenosine biosynthesis protein TsaE